HHDLISSIIDHFVSAKRVLLILATGTHSSISDANLKLKKRFEDAALEKGVKNVTVHIHDCENDDFTLYGITPKGTRVLVNSLINDIDMFFAFSDLKNHYFAGYSNPLKLFFPGVAHFSAIESNHSFTLHKLSGVGRHPFHPDPERQLNPLANDILEAYKIIVKDRPVFTFAAVSYNKDVVWAQFGRPEAVVGTAMQEVDKLTNFRVKQADKIIVSPGGYPDDESLYICQRALELTKAGVKKGGEILFVSECINGIGADRTIEPFYNKLTEPIQDILKGIQGDYKLFTHKPFKFAQLLSDLSGFLIYTDLDHEMVERIHLQKTGSIQNVCDCWIKENPKVNISVFDGANKLAIFKE
ncbi:lactate racemase domain-containing protein, partial [candidate division KSB1 bacterium]